MKLDRITQIGLGFALVAALNACAPRDPKVTLLGEPTPKTLSQETEGRVLPRAGRQPAAWPNLATVPPKPSLPNLSERAALVDAMQKREADLPSLAPTETSKQTGESNEP